MRRTVGLLLASMAALAALAVPAAAQSTTLTVTVTCGHALYGATTVSCSASWTPDPSERYAVAWTAPGSPGRSVSDIMSTSDTWPTAPVGAAITVAVTGTGVQASSGSTTVAAITASTDLGFAPSDVGSRVGTVAFALVAAALTLFGLIVTFRFGLGLLGDVVRRVLGAMRGLVRRS